MIIARVISHFDDKFAKHIVGKRIKIEEFPHRTSEYSIWWHSVNKYKIVDGKLVADKNGEKIMFFKDEIKIEK